MLVSKEVANLCRLCMNTPTTGDTTKICQDDHNYTMKIMSTLGVEIHSADQLPKQMCSSCVYQLEKFYIFRKQCRRADSKFRAFVRKVKSKKISRLDELSEDEEDNDSEDTNLALVQEYEKQMILGSVQDQVKQQVTLDRRIFLERVKQKLFEAVESLQDEEKTNSPPTILNSGKEVTKSPNKVPVSSTPSKRSPLKKEKFDNFEVTVEVPRLRVSEDGNMEEENEEDEDESDADESHKIGFASDSETGLVLLNTAMMHSCPKCNRKFNSVEKLEKHLEHHAKKNTACEYCDKCFSSMGSLHRHMKIHTQEKSFQCEVCDKKFVQKGTMIRHMLVHKEERPFACPKCDKAFTQKHMLTDHMARKHSSDASVPLLFRCHECPKTFRHSSGLSRHSLTHSGKAFDCSKCHKSLADYSSLQRHIKIVHKEVE